MSNHTPTPWPEQRQSSPEGWGVHLPDADYVHARHCVNTYDDLVWALESLKTLLVADALDGGLRLTPLMVAQGRVRDALALSISKAKVDTHE